MRSTVTIEVSLADLDAILASLRFREMHDESEYHNEWLTHRLEASAQFDFQTEVAFN